MWALRRSCVLRVAKDASATIKAQNATLKAQTKATGAAAKKSVGTSAGKDASRGTKAKDAKRKPRTNVLQEAAKDGKNLAKDLSKTEKPQNARLQAKTKSSKSESKADSKKITLKGNTESEKAGSTLGIASNTESAGVSPARRKPTRSKKPVEEIEDIKIVAGANDRQSRPADDSQPVLEETTVTLNGQHSIDAVDVKKKTNSSPKSRSEERSNGKMRKAVMGKAAEKMETPEPLKGKDPAKSQRTKDTKRTDKPEAAEKADVPKAEKATSEQKLGKGSPGSSASSSAPRVHKLDEETVKRLLSHNTILRKTRRRGARYHFFQDDRARIGVLPEIHLARKKLRENRYAMLSNDKRRSMEKVTREWQLLARVGDIVSGLKDRTVHAEFQDRLAESYYFQGKYQEELQARKNTLKYLRLESSNTDMVLALNSLCMSLMRAGMDGSDQIEDAAAACDEITPSHSDPRVSQLRHYEVIRLTGLNVGIHETIQGNMENAMDRLSSIAQYTTQGDFEVDIFCAAHYLMGRIQMLESNFEDAVMHYISITTRMSGYTPMHETAELIGGMMATELGYLCLEMGKLDLAEDLFQTSRSLVMMNDSKLGNSRRLFAVAGLAELYMKRKNLLFAEGFYKRVDEELQELPGAREDQFTNTDTDIGQFSSTTYADLWSKLLPDYADYLSNPRFHQSPRTSEAQICRAHDASLRGTFPILDLRSAAKRLPPLWYFDLMLPRYQLSGLTGNFKNAKDHQEEGANP
mmetsp:Transcript_22876/g.91553  ORF Transcript_22876/g.91553 Transcript_22876/m.91553 type:complete len:750 (-) Transcript_22876:2520-4769(-)|eukprot:CAMPEP_0113960398 /NCGR_PEP_ID=MMETSP0011_2-20120614/4687_1 /TAXON_ID=101924 /ORGANISM="Rhodosorus marinus" /LENGTH=749 /DNA_ID=CAMNT_0000971835 /DNA_START=202 /DNA_END=2451 /DNA_ORIENTATION=+ /assembly_acc=CAM_ASM_000156